MERTTLWKSYATNRGVIATILICLFFIAMSVILAFTISRDNVCPRNKTETLRATPSFSLPTTTIYAQTNNKNTTDELTTLTRTITNYEQDLKDRIKRNKQENDFLNARQQKLYEDRDNLLDKEKTAPDKMKQQTESQLEQIGILQTNAKDYGKKLTI